MVNLQDDPAAVELRKHVEGARPAKSEGSKEWPEPDLSVVEEVREPAPELPLDVFHPRLAEALRGVASNANAPVDYVAMAVLAGASACIAGSRGIWLGKSWRMAANLFVALVGDPSMLKTPAAKAAIKRLDEIGDELREKYREKWRKFEKTREEYEIAKAAAASSKRRLLREGKAKEAKEAENMVMPDKPEPPPKERTVIGDVTIEALRSVMECNPKGVLLFRDELAGLIGAFGRYTADGGQGDRGFWLEAYDGGRYRVARAGEADGRYLDIPWLNFGVIGGIQPDRLRDLLLSGSDDGFSSRFLYTWPERRERICLTEPENVEAAKLLGEVYDWLRDLPVQRLESGGVKRVYVAASREARAAMERLTNDELTPMIRAAEGMFASWLGKGRGYAGKLALLLAFTDAAVPHDDGSPRAEPIEIGTEHVQRARRLLLHYLVPMAKRSFGGAAVPREVADTRRMARWLLDRAREDAKPVTLREMQRQRVLGNRRAPAYLEVAELLCDSGWLRPVSQTRHCVGRPSRAFELNPKLADDTIPRDKCDKSDKTPFSSILSPVSQGGASENNSFGGQESAFDGEAVDPPSMSQTEKSKAETEPFDEVELTPWGAAGPPDAEIL